MGTKPAGRSGEDPLLFFGSQQEVHFISGAGYRTPSGILCDQPGGSGIPSEMLWGHGVPEILTSGTLKAGNGFYRTRQMLGLDETDRKGRVGVQEYVAESPLHIRRTVCCICPRMGNRSGMGAGRKPSGSQSGSDSFPVGKDSVTVEKDVKLPLSRRLKKQFSQEYMKYIGGEF